LRPHLKDIKPAVMTVGGWFDAENLFGALETFKNVDKSHPASANMLVMGPWLHGGWSRGDGDHLGDVRFNAKTAKYYEEKIELPFFEFHLKGKGDWKSPKAWVFETGTNVWHTYDTWPPPDARPEALVFLPGGKLGHGDARASGFDEYVSDPAKPVPFHDKTHIGMAPEYMVGDNRQAARRPDVLAYQTEVLEKDLTLAGPVKVTLHASTSGTDADWIVKLIDVYPDDYPDPDPNPTGVRMGAYQQMVRGDVMRGRFRNSYEKPEPFKPGEIEEIKFTMNDINHTFRPGHRIMVQVQSTWFPLVDRNPQTFVPSIYEAKDSDFQNATQRVFHSFDRPSRIEVLVKP
jgi:uncharacterized protein